MTSMNAILLLDYLSVRRQQQETHLQILRNEALSAERSYNLLFSYISHNQRTNTRDPVDEMTGILSSLSNTTSTRRNTSLRGENTRRSTPSLASQLRSTINRSTNTEIFPNNTRYWRATPRTFTTPRRNDTFTWNWPITASFNATPPPPTQAEIEIATVTCKFRDVSTNQLMCPIARTNFEDNDDILKIIHCNHIFKKESLLTWFETKQTCPICRHNITGSTDTTSTTGTTRTTGTTSDHRPIFPPV